MLTQLCSPDEFGKYSLIFMLMLFGLTPFRNFTVEAMMANPTKFPAREYLSSTLVISFFVSLLFGGILGSFLLFFGEQYEIQGAAWSIYFYCISRYLIELGRGYFFTYTDPLKALIIDVICSVSILVLLFQHHIGGMNYIEVLHIISASYLIGFLVALFMAKPSLKINKSAILANLNFGKWLCFTGIFIWFNGNFLLLIATGILGNFVAGAVRAINNLFGPISILFQTIENYVPVRAANILSKEGHKAMIAYLTKQAKWTSLIFIPVFILISFGSGLIISSLFGDSYLPYKSIIPFIIFAQILGFYVRYFNIALRTFRHTVPIFLGYAITAFLSIISSEMLVESFGFLGFGVGIILFQLVLIGFLFWHVRRYINNLDQSLSNTDLQRRIS
jgi:O-antigen/teichoic acid export membrane protein